MTVVNGEVVLTVHCGNGDAELIGIDVSELGNIISIDPRCIRINHLTVRPLQSLSRTDQSPVLLAYRSHTCVRACSHTY